MTTTVPLGTFTSPGPLAASGAESPELVELFRAYTGGGGGIGSHLTQAAARVTARDPLIVATGSDLALYPGGGRPPRVEPFRLSTRGFKELAAVSHLGPALASLARMRALEPDGPWRRDAQDLLATTRNARRANSPGLWADRIAVAAFAGREPAIAAMVDYSCRITERVLERALADGSYLAPETLRTDYLSGPHADLPVPFDRVMVATFFLTGLDIAHRLLRWFDEMDLPWHRVMAIIAGRQGRSTAGVTLESNSVAGVVLAASRGHLAEERLLIAPHAPVFPQFDGVDLDPVAAFESDYRLLWAGSAATAALGEDMFAGHPRFAPPRVRRTPLRPGMRTIAEKPAVQGPDDWPALIARMRLVLEDPRQLLSGAVTDYAAAQLAAHGNRPRDVTVPGLDGEPYPALAEMTGDAA